MEEEWFDFLVIFVFAEIFFLRTELGEFDLDGVSLGAYLGGEGFFGFARDKMKLVGAEAVGQGGILGALGGADAVKPGRGSALGVAIIVQQGVLRGKAALGLIKLGGASAGGEPGFEEGDLVVLVEVGGGVKEGGGEVSAQAAEVLFESAAGGGEDDAVGVAEGGEEGGAGGSAVEQGKGAIEILQPSGEFVGGKIGAREIEAGGLAVVGTVPDEDDPQGVRTFAGLGLDELA